MRRTSDNSRVTSISGQPLDRFYTGHTSESSVQGLAGNAMTTVVVGAAMIALLILSP